MHKRPYVQDLVSTSFSLVVLPYSMSSITLTVTIDATQIESLKSNGFNLCLAKASANGSEPTVIWHGAE